MDYWEECIISALEEAQLTATDGQIGIIADCVKGSHENYGMAHGYDVIQRHSEIRKKEDWVAITDPCPRCHTRGTVCGGTGRIKKYW